MVAIIYTWKLDNWEILESGRKLITIWSWEVIKWIDAFIAGKKVGKKYKLTVEPKDAYWDLYTENNQQHISSFIFEKLWISTKTWDIVTLDKTTWKILRHETDKDWNNTIVFDVNPVQTRQDISYEITILEIQKK